MLRQQASRRTIGLALTGLLLVLSSTADARSRHGRGAHARSIHVENGRRAENDKLKAASDAADKLLDTRIKNICRGC